MKISDHADHTEKLYKLRAEDIHKWIDGYFDRQGFDEFLQIGRTPGFNPYTHRKFRHCHEALPEVIKEFSYKYANDQIQNVFECHIKDDYDNYIPTREDFSNGTFSEKYHESEESKEKILTSGELERYFSGNYSGRKQNRSSPERFGLRIVLPAIISLIIFILSIFLIILPLFHESLMEEKKEMIMEISSVAVSILDYYASMESEGSFSREKAQSTALDEIQKLRYGPDHENYFWITDMQPVMVMHPWRPDLNGQDLSDYTDSKNRSGKKLFVESVQLVQDWGGGFLEYLWQPDESSLRVVPKLSYVQGLPQWKWIIGTGIYIHDVEDEISRLTDHLVIIFLIISFLMFMILVYMVIESRTIERNRQHAETGLIEAKERYRALVEASNEGYILILNHRNIFFNPTFQRMTGYTEQDLLSGSIWDQLFTSSVRSNSLKFHLENLKSEAPNPDEFEAMLRCQSGSFIDVVVRVSRIFLSEENGQVVSFRPIIHSSLPLYIDTVTADNPDIILKEIQASESNAHVVRILNQLPLSIRSMLDLNVGAEKIRIYISKVYSFSVQRIIELSIDEMGKPPADFAFLSLGSSGRQEMTLFSDQDNAIVFNSEKTGEGLEATRLYFLNLADKVCSRLNQAGFPYCPGGIMAVNPAYCLSLEEWYKKYSYWITKADNNSLLDIHVFFDLSCVWGDGYLVDELKLYIFKLSQNRPEFLSHFAGNCLQYKAPVGLLGTVKTEERDGMSVVNLKECLIPLINFVRIYALRSEISDTSTLKRIQSLEDIRVLNKPAAKDLKKAFEILWELRFTNQIISHGALRKVNDDLILKNLSVQNRKDLQWALSVISGIQSRLSFDFLGMDIS